MTKIVTHNGHFHADEILAVAALTLLYPDTEVVRSRDEAVINTGDIVVDVGGKYDPSHSRFDHHQQEGAGKRANGIPYASFGLVWKEFGERISGGQEEAQIIDDKLAVPVDAVDNGIDTSKSFLEGVKEYSLGDFFESFAAGAEGLEDLDRGFFQALPLAKELLKREIVSAKKAVIDRRKVREIYDKSIDKRIIVLDEGMSWRYVLIPTEAQFVIFPRPDGTWSARAVPTSINTFALKTPFPKSWAGLKGVDLVEVSGVPDALFCHRDIWLANAQSQEGAIKLAQIALNA